MASDDPKDGWDRLGDRLDNKAGDLADSKHPILKIGLWILGLIVVGLVISFVVGWISFANSYVNAGRQIISPENISKQYALVIGDWQGLLTATGNACSAVNAAPNSNSPTLVENPAFAYAAQARTIRSDYNRRQHNLFESKLVGPKGYPATVPDQQLMDQAKPNWCKINRDLAAVHS